MTTTPEATKGVPRLVGDPAPTLRADHNALADWVLANVDASVLNSTFLPTTGNWIGRTRYTESDNSLWVWDGSWTRAMTVTPVSFTPTWNGLTVGNGSSQGSYTISGGRCFVTSILTFGSTTTTQGALTVSLPPVTASAIYSGTSKQSIVGAARFLNLGSAAYVGTAVIFGSNLSVVDASALAVSGTNVITSSLTWGGASAGDVFSLAYDYVIA